MPRAPVFVRDDRALCELPAMTKAEIQDARAVWLGYRDASDYLSRAADELKRKRRPDRWVWSHYRAIFMGQLRRR